MVTKSQAKEGVSGASTYAETYSEESNDGSARFVAPPRSREFMASLNAETIKLRAQLEAQPKKTVYLPARSSSNDTRPVPIQINQVKFLIPRGIAFEVPSQIYDMLKQADVW